MKNIFLLPTVQPCRLFIDEYKLQLDIESYGVNGLNMYITSDEEIKVGDWYLVNQYGNGLLLATQPATAEDIKYQHKFECKKIILTTDAKLIAVGIQEIDNTFLEWFIENPTCEYVEVEDYYNPKNMVYGINTNPYEIIIPQEKSKTLSYEEFIEKASDVLLSKFNMYELKYSDGTSESYFYSNYKYWVDMLKEEESKSKSKSKTLSLEEAAENYAEHQLKGMSDKTSKFECINDFIAGAKHMTEQNGLMEIELRHTKTLLESCEKALEDRDKKIAEMFSLDVLKETFKQSRQCKLFEKDMPPVYETFEEWFATLKK